MFFFACLTLTVLGLASGQPNCPSFPPCGENMKNCPSPATASTTATCPPPPNCIQSQVLSSIRGKGMCDNPCPVTCKDNEVRCHGGEDFNGCRMADTCMPMGADGCSPSCPVMCKTNEVVCSFSPPNTKCPPTQMCMPGNQKVMVEHQCSGFCPMACTSDQIQCDSKDPFGCPMIPTCIPKFTSNSKDGKLTCPNYCPSNAPCKVDETPCPGQTGPDGCRMPDTCVPKDTSKDNWFCSGVCPVTCPDGQMRCEDTEQNGCRKQPTCIPATYAGTKPGKTCPNQCLVTCPANSKACYAMPDENGCIGPTICAPVVKGTDGWSCPAACPATCNKNQVPCPAKSDSRGCPLEGTCATSAADCPK